MEIWKNIKGYEGYYEVSNYGRIKSLKDFRGRNRIYILRQQKNKDGYNRVELHKDGKRKTYMVHRLVAEAFIPNPNNLPFINHKNEFEKDNNKVENLEWCTSKYNVNYGTKIDRTKEKLNIKVKCITTEEIFNSITEASRKYKTYKGRICGCCKGRFKSAGKHPETGEPLIWEYYKGEN